MRSTGLGRLDASVDCAMMLGKADQATNEELAREERRHANAQHPAAARALLEARRDIVELAQQRLDLSAKLDTQARQREIACAPLEQRRLQAFFERFDLVAD